MIKHLLVAGAIIGRYPWHRSHSLVGNSARCSSRLGFGGASCMVAGPSYCWESRIAEQPVSRQDGD